MNHINKLTNYIFYLFVSALAIVLFISGLVWAFSETNERMNNWSGPSISTR